MYNLGSAFPIICYLNGELGDPTQLPPEISSLLFAQNRREGMLHIEDLYLRHGRHFLCDRYTGSNLSHQGAKVEGLERQRVIDWIKKIEFEDMGINRPDLTILLDLPVEIALEALRQRGEQDGHEINEKYQREVHETYLWLAETQPNWTVVNCMNRDSRKAVEEIAGEIWNVIKPII